ncbi:hypothetical protein [Haloarcula pelagica]|uniref:hypothetical protein n=1 Tax=Haloarcula pelagica TaxID=3033389 RepID=UPI0024C23AB9|nr:hypothetical protein [Halomicroarcula sp. YJ-61-S]
MSDDPSVISSLAIHAKDLVAAAETTARDEKRAVLRVTPPFSGRMRARLHVVQGDPEPAPIHLDPWTLLTDDAPAYPLADDTEDELRGAVDETYSIERHRDYHEQRVEEWRDAVLDHVRETATLADTETAVSVTILGP